MAADSLFRLAADGRLRADDLVASKAAALVADDFFGLAVPVDVAATAAVSFSVAVDAVGRGVIDATAPLAISATAAPTSRGQIAATAPSTLVIAAAGVGHTAIAAVAPTSFTLGGAVVGTALFEAGILLGVDVDAVLVGRGLLEAVVPTALSLPDVRVLRGGKSDGTIRVRIEIATPIAADVEPATEIRSLVLTPTTIRTEAEDPVEVGDEARIIGEFRVNGTLTDPTALKIVIRPPTAERYELVYPDDEEITRIAAGRYAALVPVTETGSPGRPWRFQWVSTGAAAGAKTGSFDVDHGAL